MTDTNPRAVMGANNPPDPIDHITAFYNVSLDEAANWTDGTPVENEAQMKAVDALREDMRQWRLALEKGQKSATAPLYDAYKLELARWKPTIDDAKRIESCLMAAVEPYKRKLAEEKAAAERAAWEVANKARREAEEAARKANAADLDAQRAVEAARQAAADAKQQARAARDDRVKGLRTETETVVLDHLALARWLWVNDRDAVLQFNADRARKLALDIAGVVERQTKKVAR